MEKIYHPQWPCVAECEPFAYLHHVPAARARFSAPAGRFISPGPCRGVLSVSLLCETENALVPSA